VRELEVAEVAPNADLCLLVPVGIDPALRRRRSDPPADILESLFALGKQVLEYPHRLVRVEENDEVLTLPLCG
jgi:hypothetical protein